MRTSNLVVGILYMIAIVLPVLQPSVQTATAEGNIWADGLVLESDEILAADDNTNPYCTVTDASVQLYRYQQSLNGRHFANPESQIPYATDTRETCVVQSDIGMFTYNYYGGGFSDQLWSPDDNLQDMIVLEEDVRAIPNSRAVVRSAGTYFPADPVGSLRYGIDYYMGNGGTGELIEQYRGSGASARINKEWRVNGNVLLMEYAGGEPMPIYSWEFSANGKYGVLALANGILARINIDTQEIQPFATFSSNIRNWRMAISNDGNYVVTNAPSTSQHARSPATLHDLSGCNTSYPEDQYPISGADITGCQSTDIEQDIISAYPDYALNNYMVQPWFYRNGSKFSVDVVYSPATNARHRLTFAPTNYVTSAYGYLALGDSFSSGEGETIGGTWYEPGTDEQGDISNFDGRNLCHLSRRSYPYLLALENTYIQSSVVAPAIDGDFHSVACSGALMRNIIGGDRGLFIGQGDSDEFDVTDNQYQHSNTGSLDVWQPGHIKQLDFIVNAPVKSIYREAFSPEVITVGIGGNDVGFSGHIKACAYPGTCGAAVAESPQATDIALATARLKTGLTTTYSKIKLESPEARVYAVGYPIFVQGYNGDCGFNVKLNSEETILVEEGVKYMNDVIEAAAAEAGVVYVDVENILDSRNLCSGALDEDIAVNGITAGNDFLGGKICLGRSGCLGNESYHPNHIGHALYAAEIQSQTNGLTTPMPEPVETDYPLPNPGFFGQNAVDIINIYNGSGIPADQSVLEPRSLVEIIYGAANDAMRVSHSGLMPLSYADISLHSTPVDLGQFQVTSDGTVDEVIELPPGVEPGAHQIRIKGVDAYGSPIEYYDYIIVSADEEDFDGDGILNEIDPCPTIPAAGIDEDNDGIDDGCDPQILEEVPPVPAAPENVVAATSAGNPYTATIAWDASALVEGQSPVSTYTVNATDNDEATDDSTYTCATSSDETTDPITLAATTCDIADLPLNTPYTFTVVASNAEGDSEASAASNALTLTDTVAPNVFGYTTTQPNIGGWYNAAVTTSWTVSDDLDGPLPSPTDVVLAADGANQIVESAEVCDSSGNCATGQVDGISIDTLAPLVDEAALTSGTIAVGASTDLIVTASDGLSGVGSTEWYIGDTDPGEGQANAMSYDGVANSWTTAVDAGTTAGIYDINIRTQDLAGNWSELTTINLVAFDPTVSTVKGAGKIRPDPNDNNTRCSLALRQSILESWRYCQTAKCI